MHQTGSTNFEETIHVRSPLQAQRSAMSSLSEPGRMDPEALMSVSARADAMATELEGVLAPAEASFPSWQGSLAAGLAAAGNHLATASMNVASIRAWAQGLREAVAQYEGADEQNAAILAQLDQLPDELKDQLPQEVKNQLGGTEAAAEAGFKEKLPFEESPDPPPPGMHAPTSESDLPNDVVPYNSQTGPLAKAATAAAEARQAPVARCPRLGATPIDHAREFRSHSLDQNHIPVRKPDDHAAARELFLSQLEDPAPDELYGTIPYFDGMTATMRAADRLARRLWGDVDL